MMFLIWKFKNFYNNTNTNINYIVDQNPWPVLITCNLIQVFFASFFFFNGGKFWLILVTSIPFFLFNVVVVMFEIFSIRKKFKNGTIRWCFYSINYIILTKLYDLIVCYWVKIKRSLTVWTILDVRLTPTRQVWIHIYTLVLIMLSLIVGGVILTFNNRVIVFERVVFQNEKGIWLNSNIVYTHYPTLVNWIVILVLTFLVLFGLCFISFQVSSVISIIGFLGMNAFIGIYLFVIVFPKCNCIMFYYFWYTTGLMIFFLFTLLLVSPKLEPRFEIERLSIPFFCYNLLLIFTIFIPLIRKVITRFVRFTLNLGAKIDQKPGRYVADPPTPFYNAILDCMREEDLERKPFTEDQIIRIATDASEFDNLKDLLEPFVTNDGLFVMWYVGAMMYLVPFWNPSWITIREMAYLFLNFQKAIQIRDVARRDCEHYSKEFFILFYNDKAPIEFQALQYQAWMNGCPPLISTATKIFLILGGVAIGSVAYYFIKLWLQDQGYLPPAEPDGLGSDTEVNSQNIRPAQAFSLSEEAREYATRERNRLISRREDDEIVQLDGQALNLPDSNAVVDVQPTGRIGTGRIDESSLTAEQRQMVVAARRSADKARQAIEQVRREAAARVSLTDRGVEELTPENIASEAQRLASLNAQNLPGQNLQNNNVWAREMQAVSDLISPEDDESANRIAAPENRIEQASQGGDAKVSRLVLREHPSQPIRMIPSEFANASITASIDVPIAQPVDVPVVPPIDVPVAQPVDVPVAQPVDVLIAQPVDVPIVQPIDVPVAQPVDVPIVQPIDVPAAQPIVAPAIEPAVAPTTEPIVAPATEPVVERSTGPRANSYVWKRGQLYKWVKKK